MQIARAATGFGPGTQASAVSAVPVDVVAPDRLVAIARIRFDSALTTLRPSGGTRAPSSLATTIAVDQVQQGLGTLRGVLVPTTSYALRRDAALAIDTASRAIPLLRAYQQQVEQLGDGPFGFERVPTDARARHDEALRLIEDALVYLR